MSQAAAFAFAPTDTTGKSHHMLAASACRLILELGGRHTPTGNNTAVDRAGDTHVTGSAEEHRGKWRRQSGHRTRLSYAHGVGLEAGPHGEPAWAVADITWRSAGRPPPADTPYGG
jgi:hypothetical protein